MTLKCPTKSSVILTQCHLSKCIFYWLPFSQLVPEDTISLLPARGAAAVTSTWNILSTDNCLAHILSFSCLCSKMSSQEVTSPTIKYKIRYFPHPISRNPYHSCSVSLSFIEFISVWHVIYAYVYLFKGCLLRLAYKQHVGRNWTVLFTAVCPDFNM